MSDIQGISILIPVYNFDIRPLIEKLTEEIKIIQLPIEIRCYDDCSSEHYHNLNIPVATYPVVFYERLNVNIGRSRIRNKLAKEAKYDHLLFLDSDSLPVQNTFLKNYILSYQSNSIVSGGTRYHENNDPSFSLRYKYGKCREEISAEKRRQQPYRYINLNNLFIPKKIYLAHELDESIQTYGHEDTKFADNIRSSSIQIIQIDNPVFHIGLEPNEIFLKKSGEAVKNFYKIIQEGYGHHSNLYRAYSFLKKTHLDFLFKLFYRIFKRSIEKNLISTSPRLLNFDLYKLNLLLNQ